MKDSADLHVKLMFRLLQDDDGYPPVATEGLWAQKVADGYVLDNIPFFAREATVGDTVSVVEEDGVLWFSGVVKRSSSSLIRIAMFDPGRFDELRNAMISLGCECELFAAHRIVSVNVPGSARLEPVQEYLARQAAAGWLDYEEPLLRH